MFTRYIGIDYSGAQTPTCSLKGYTRHGDHPEHRKRIFVGDLCDRGPDRDGATGPQLVGGRKDLKSEAGANPDLTETSMERRKIISDP
jgi:hypothetical protein